MNHPSNSKSILGRSNLKAGPLGLASSFGAPAEAYELAFERGCNYFYWGSLRRDGMAQAIHNLAPRHRENMVIVLQSYSRWGGLLKATLKSGLKKLKQDYADVLLLGWYNSLPSNRVMDTALELKQKGVIKAIAISSHNRPAFQTYVKDPRFDIIMVRYNAAHRGAEKDTFPHLENSDPRPGVVTYTTTRWRHLINPQFMPPDTKTPTAGDCYRFVLANPNVDVCMSGPASMREMEENLAAVEKGPMSDEEMAWMRKVGDHIYGQTFFDMAIGFTLGVIRSGR
ncbi:aldo/keto reductase [Elusimicrobiota bacterium]